MSYVLMALLNFLDSHSFRSFGTFWSSVVFQVGARADSFRLAGRHRWQASAFRNQQAHKRRIKVLRQKLKIVL